MAKASYQYDTRKDEVTGKVTLVIVDKDAGGMSVTNDIDDVIEEICLITGLVSAKVDVVYKDSNGQWDGYDPKTRSFIFLGETSSTAAIDKLAVVRAKTVQ